MTRNEIATEMVSVRSLCAIHKLVARDHHYDLQLLRALKIANDRAPIEPNFQKPISSLEWQHHSDADDRSLRTMGTEYTSRGIDPLKTLNIAASAAIALTTSCSSSCTKPSPYDESNNPSSTSTSYRMKLDRRYVRPTIKHDALIMPFFDHSFSSACFDTIRCRVLYNNRYDTNDNDPSPSLTDTIRNNLHGSWILFDFPSIAHVTWTSKSGTSHDEKIDLGNIFHSKLIRYSPELDVNQVNLEAFHDGPEIILVVVDRSIQVYMRAWISLKAPREPTKPLSDFRNDLILVYTRHF